VKPLRTIVIGIDHVHARLYADPWSDTHDIVGFSTTSGEAASRYASHFPRAHVSGHWHDLLTQCQPVELAYVLGRHCDMSAAAEAVASAGIPFVLEKPGGVNVGEVDALIDVANACGVPATVPFVQRVGPLPDLFRLVGALQHCSFQFITGRAGRYVDAGSEWMLKRREAGGGVLLNLGVHFVDLFRHLTGDPLTHVAGHVFTFDDSLEVEDHASALLTAAGGARAVVEVSYTFPLRDQRHVSFTAVGEDGALYVNSEGGVHLQLSSGAEVGRSVDVDSNHYYRSFVRLVHETYDAGFQGLPTLGDLRLAVEAVHAVYQPAPHLKGAIR